MRPVSKTQAGVGQTQAIPFDVAKDNFSVGFGVKVTGTVTYTVQHTFSQPALAGSVDFSNAVWFDNSSLTAQTTDQDGNYIFPITAMRVNVTAGSGSITIQAIQAGVGV